MTAAALPPEELPDFARYHRALPHDDGVPHSACMVCRLLATLDAARASSPDLATLDVERLIRAYEATDIDFMAGKESIREFIVRLAREYAALATPAASSEAAASQGEDYEPIEVDPEVAEAAARWSRGEPLFGEPARHYATLTRNGKFGAGLWLDGRLVARIVATVEDSRVSEDEPEPRWLRDAMVFVNAVNDAARASQPSPDLATLPRPYCPCGGTCHHSESPCSLGCWAAQKPWRVEETLATLAARVVGIESGYPKKDGQPVGPGGRAFEQCREAVLRLLATPAASSEAAASPGDDRPAESPEEAWSLGYAAGWAAASPGDDRLSQGTALTDDEVETIYAAYVTVLCEEARTIEGRRRIVEPIYRAVIAARVQTAQMNALRDQQEERTTCENCLRPADQVDAETGHCFDCWDRAALATANADDGDGSTVRAQSQGDERLREAVGDVALRMEGFVGAAMDAPSGVVESWAGTLRAALDQEAGR